MKIKQLKLAVVIAALAAAQLAGARELKIPQQPQLPTAVGQEQVVQSVPKQVDPAEYGMEQADESAARTALQEAQAKQPSTSPAPSANAKPSSAAAIKQTIASQKGANDQIQVTGGGRSADLQSVPASVAQTGGSQAEPVEMVSSLEEVVVQPGVNTIIPAALGHLNRIVTPFENPIVQTTAAKEDITVKDNVVYVTANDPSPITMYITPKDDESIAISLTLAPKKVPPIQANLILGQAPGFSGKGSATPGAGGYRYSGQAKKWEEGQPYMESIKGIMRALALGGIPKGYSMGKLSSTDTLPACYQEGIQFDFSKSQLMMGHNFKVLVGVARNTLKVPVMFDETSCTHPLLAASAAWPRNMLEPGDKTEIYVVTRVSEAPSDESTRPSLLN
ncbi:type-F conjugative transfer system secretin TraK [Pseudomonas sp. LS-2]|uniref:TraK domain-containing protein n=1 Tax=Pseudomonas sp. LS-2 TaxID=2315859 RepID=UPI000E753409|nr:type-F conjugative transfer system secretin TraK [Pseudomonas sp. LS-2]RJX72625.1 transfer protein [Pseudomonas sp. LS-2]